MHKRPLMMTPRHKSELIERLQRRSFSAHQTRDCDLGPNFLMARENIDQLKPSAILLPFFQKNGDIHVILTRRALHLKHHPGQISFPGGRRDERDTTLEETALREAFEEITLPPSSVDILAPLPAHHTLTGFSIYSFIGWIEALPPLRFDRNEVAEIFEVPLSHFSNPAHYKIQSRHWKGVERSYYTIPYGPYYIWGATAYILHSLAVRLQSKVTGQ